MYNKITLEMSLKPFKRTDAAYIESVVRTVFSQWCPLVKNADTVSVMLWVSDGSEILDYARDMSKAFEWAYLIGRANGGGKIPKSIDPDGTSLHNGCYLYMDEPPTMTYEILKSIVATIKRVGREMLPDKRIEVGETFDPGPEFAKSDFKYKYHNEICGGSAMGHGSMVDAASTVSGDSRPYAAYPDGIPDGVSFGTFFGKQCQEFLTDMDFDYIWLSNGLGFGREMWSTSGAIFDGKNFDGKNLDRVSKNVFKFWEDFRRECTYPIETRGTNMSMGIDYATDGVPLKKIYDGVEKLLPPPNSPWAALNFDYGLELMGHMSRIANVPQDGKYLFRYYIHDPWWVNTPWYDRYEGLPNDIYLPMSIARVNKGGRVCPPTNLNLLSIDNSYGDLPDSCANEPTPHLIKAAKEAPDAPSPIVWVYPFNEYSSTRGSSGLSEMFAGDWFIRNSINSGVPVNTVVSTDNFVANDKSIYSASILISAVPMVGGEYESEIIEYVKRGGKVIFYGSVTNASERFRSFIGVELTDGVSGELELTVGGEKQRMIKHDPTLSGGLIDTRVASDAVSVLATAGERAYAVAGDGFVWLRATNSSDYTGAQLLIAHKRSEYYKGEELMLTALSHLGFDIEFNRLYEDAPAVINTVHRHNNAFIYSMYAKDTTVEMKMRTELGVPALSGGETLIKDGVGYYRFPRFERRECRVFVEQAEGVITVKEWPPVSVEYRRRIRVKGLKGATVRFFAEDYCKDTAVSLVNGIERADSDVWAVGDKHEHKVVTDKFGTYIELRDVTGDIMFSMPVK